MDCCLKRTIKTLVGMFLFGNLYMTLGLKTMQKMNWMKKRYTLMQ